MYLFQPSLVYSQYSRPYLREIVDSKYCLVGNHLDYYIYFSPLYSQDGTPLTTELRNILPVNYNNNYAT